MPRALPVAMTSSTIKWLEFKVSSGEKGKKKNSNSMYHMEIHVVQPLFSSMSKVLLNLKHLFRTLGLTYLKRNTTACTSFT